MKLRIFLSLSSNTFLQRLSKHFVLDSERELQCMKITFMDVEEFKTSKLDTKAPCASLSLWKELSTYKWDPQKATY